jgi:hypothetical protein
MWKNVFAFPSQGRPPVPSAQPTQNADLCDWQALVGEGKNGLGCCRRVSKHLKSRGEVANASDVHAIR